MVQVDLITGFLGAGKTTFLRRYAAWWAGQDVKVCVLENDFGAVNVDAMLLQDLEAQGVELETISGGCDCDTHQRRMRTKLISMAMRGFGRVIVEPSGIFDVDEFFDVLRDEPLDRWYQLGNVIAIVDALLPEELSPQAEYILASESAWAGSVLLSRCQLASDAQKQGAEAHLARALEACKCSRKFGPEEIIAKDWADLTGDDIASWRFSTPMIASQADADRSVPKRDIPQRHFGRCAIPTDGASAAGCLPLSKSKRPNIRNGDWSWSCRRRSRMPFPK